LGSGGTGSGGGAGKVSFSPLSVGLALPSSLTDLLAETASGHDLKGVRIEGVTSGDHAQAFYDLTLTNVNIADIHEKNGAGDRLTFDNYDQIFLATHGQQSDGTLAPAETFGWNVKTSAEDGGTAPVLTPGHDGSSGPLTGGKYFLLIDGVDGGSRDHDHIGWFEIDSFNFDEINFGSAGTGSGGGAGKVLFSPLTVGLALPSSLTDIFADTATGDHLKGVRIEGVTSGDHSKAFYDLTLTNVTITNVHEQNGGGDLLRFDDYDKIFLETHAQTADGSPALAETFGWNVRTNKAEGGTAPALAPGHDGSSGPLTGGKYFLLVDGVDGGSRNQGHDGWFEIDSFNFDATNTGSGGTGSGGGAGKVSFSPLTVDLALPSSLTDLLTETASGHDLKGVRIEGVTSGEHPKVFYDLTLTDVTITRTHEQNGGGDVLTFDNYDKIFLETHGQTADGSPVVETFAWDVAKAQLIHNGFDLA
jgi:type VI secretion system secreted protein Hcp